MNYLCKFEYACDHTEVWLCLYDASSGECIHELAESVENASGGTLVNKYDYTEVRPCLAS